MTNWIIKAINGDQEALEYLKKNYYSQAQKELIKNLEDGNTRNQ